MADLYNGLIDNLFIREIKDKHIENPSEILNWYRNLYYKEDNDNERYIMAKAINDYFCYENPRAERHANWVKIYYKDTWYHKCSNCGRKEWSNENYCAKCGCRMDEVVE